MSKRTIRKPGGARTELEAEIPRACVDDAAAVEFLERQRWGDQPTCPHCGAVEPAPRQLRDAKTGERNRRFLWACAACGKQFTVKVGTVLEDSRVPFRCWVHALWSIASNKKGVSALQISRETGLSYKSALFVMHRLRHAMMEEGGAPTEKMAGTIQADLTFVGGKPRKHGLGSRGIRHHLYSKTPVLAVLQQGARVRAQRLPPATKDEIGSAIREAVDLSRSRLMTDEGGEFKAIGKEFTAHDTVRHASHEYSRGDITSNEAESFFALIKRGHYGIFHSYSRKHLPKYVAEHEFRWNTRKLDDGERTVAVLRATEGKRLRYKAHVGRV